MAIYTTFFLAEPGELCGGFPGWKLPLPAPVRREVWNFFKKQNVIIETREPEWPDKGGASTAPQYQAAPIQGRYEDYLENRLLPFIREKPHWVAKGLTEIELQPLLSAIGASSKLEPAIYAPPSSAKAVLEFPPDFSAKVSASDRSVVAQRWAAEMSSPKHTHSVTGRKLKEGWTNDQALQILTPIISLASKVATGQKVYLLIEA